MKADPNQYVSESRHKALKTHPTPQFQSSNPFDLFDFERDLGYLFPFAQTGYHSGSFKQWSH